MTQTHTPARTPLEETGPARSAPAQPVNPIRAVLSSVFEGTPGRMRLVGAAAALVAAAFGIVSATSLWSSSAALERAGHNTAQVVRVQGIYADLLRADADATNAFLVGGLEDPAQRADYDNAMGRVATAIAGAATAQPADGTALGVLNSRVQSYATSVQQARADNRQGLPVGAQYLKNASTSLRTTTLPLVDAVAQANVQRATREFAASSTGVILVGSGAVAFMALVLVMVWLARQTHRYVNLPLALASALVVLATLVGASALGSVGTRISQVQASDYQSTLSLAAARSAAFDAKSQESLTLIARAGSASEASWKAPANTVLANLRELGTAQGPTSPVAAELTRQWNAYASEHETIRKLDDAGQWDQAVTAATRTDSGSANALFTTFTASAAASLRTFEEATQASLGEPRLRVTLTAWALLAICLGAAVLAVRGITERLKEYR